MSGDADPAWEPVPATVTWTLETPISHGGMRFSTVTLVAPTAEQAMKASAVRGASNMEVVCRLISNCSAERVPYEAVQQIPEWIVGQMAAYFEEFAGAPAPGPLEAWRQARKAAQAAAASAPTGETPPPV